MDLFSQIENNVESYTKLGIKSFPVSNTGYTIYGIIHNRAIDPDPYFHQKYLDAINRVKIMSQIKILKFFAELFRYTVNNCISDPRVNIFILVFKYFVKFFLECGIPSILFLHPEIVISDFPHKEPIIDYYNKNLLNIVREEIYNFRKEVYTKTDPYLDTDLQDIITDYEIGGNFSRRRPDNFGFSCSKSPKKGRSPKKTISRKKKSR